MYIVVSIIAFGLLIVVHELGHFAVAKLLGVRVNEFAIGMGPKLLKKQGKETLYSIRAFPLGGFCALEGENGDSEDSRAFAAQKRWRRILILAAGAAANVLAGFIIVVIIYAGATEIPAKPTITYLVDGFPYGGEQGLMVGDTILSINGEHIYYIDDFRLFMELSKDGKVDIIIRRDGEKVKLNGFLLKRHKYVIDGEESIRYGITFTPVEANASERFQYSCYTTINNIRIVRVSLAMLFKGDVGLTDMSGFPGIVNAMNDIGQSSPSISVGLKNIANFTALISVNLAIMNLLPIPALDGGRILFIIINYAVEKVSRRRINPKYEGYIHTTAMVLLMCLMAFTFVNDIIKIIK